MELTSFSVFWQQFLFEHWSKRQQRGDPNRFQQQRLWCWNDLLMKVGLLSVSESAWIKQTQTCGSLYLALVSRSSPIPFLCFFSFTFKTQKTQKNIYWKKISTSFFFFLNFCLQNFQLVRENIKPTKCGICCSWNVCHNPVK